MKICPMHKLHWAFVLSRSRDPPVFHVFQINQKNMEDRKMNDYNKNYFWTTKDPVTEEKKYFFKIRGYGKKLEKRRK